MELINKIRKSRKGFTLVEIIVVLVILAILAAFMIPSMLGFVGDAKKKAAIAEQREVYIAAQAIATEQFAKYGADGDTGGAAKLGMTLTGTSPATKASTSVATNLGSAKAISTATAGSVELEMYNYLSGDITPGTGTTDAVWIVTVSDKGKVTKVEYTKDGVKLDDLVPSNKVK